YSQYANLNTYNRMIDSYNAAIEDYIVERESLEDAFVFVDNEGNHVEDGFIVVNAEAHTIFIGDKSPVKYIDYVSKDEDRFIFLRINAINIKDGIIRANGNIEYYIDTDKMLANDERRAEVEALVKTDVEEGETAVTLQDACKLWVQTKGREAAKVTFEENDHSFLWIKNIWYPDTTLAHPVRSYSEFVNSISAKVQIGDTKYKITEYPSSPYQNETAYNEITYLLGEQKSEGNGYFILIVLSIGTMVLSQFIMSRMQKDQTELQSADGSGQRSMKMMMIIMPVMYGFFSFSYSSSFSIYMVTSNVCGILTSLVTTWIVDLIFKKNEDKQFREKYESRYRASKGILGNNSQKKK
ncbi:MAG: YidC/Oxa1 family membrane protein insertase, partial [Christensenellaceae bacterium]